MLKFPEYRLRNPDRSDSLPNYLIGHPMLSADHVPPITIASTHLSHSFLLKYFQLSPNPQM